MAEGILQGLLNFNVVGFQTTRDKRNFIAALKHYLPMKIGFRRVGSRNLISAGDTHTVVGVFPVSIDFNRFARCSSEDVNEVKVLRRRLPTQKIFLGVDRLDYTKGIIERLSAFDLLLRQHRELLGSVHFIQVVVPCREEVKSYRELRCEIERHVSRINGEFGRVGWLPITYLYRRLSRQELRTYYRAADVAVVTPLRDGMNLVAKEFCASRDDGSGALILSEFAGAAEELSIGALLTNPYDVLQFAAIMESALKMRAAECGRRMRLMRDQIRVHDVSRWSSAFRKTRCTDLVAMHAVEPVHGDFSVGTEVVV